MGDNTTSSSPCPFVTEVSLACSLRVGGGSVDADDEDEDEDEKVTAGMEVDVRLKSCDW